MPFNKEIVIVENIRLVPLLDLTAYFGVKNKNKKTRKFDDADFQAAREEQNWYLKTVCTQ